MGKLVTLEEVCRRVVSSEYVLDEDGEVIGQFVTRRLLIPWDPEKLTGGNFRMVVTWEPLVDGVPQSNGEGPNVDDQG